MELTWEPIGEVMRTQLHRAEIAHDNWYDLARLAVADELALSVDGVVGLVNGERVLDYHHRNHPELHRWNPGRLLSIGFLGHYVAMRAKFGDVPTGVAAENVLVDSANVWDEARLSKGIKIVGQEGETVLVDAAVAKPCNQFTRFLLGDGHSDEVVAEHRRFLGQGMRGFVMDLATSRPMTIRVGDEVFVAS